MQCEPVTKFMYEFLNFLFSSFFSLIFLAQLAKKYLGIPASQASCERLFSISKNDITETRTCILPDLAESLLFVRKRKDILDLTFNRNK